MESAVFTSHVQKLVAMTGDEAGAIVEYFREFSLKKKQNILRDGQVCDKNLFVSSGCLRMFFIDRKGVEQTIQFALENWWLADYNSFLMHKPSGFYIQAVEDTKGLSIDPLSQEKLLQDHPLMERYFRLIHQRAHAAAQYRMKTSYDLSREEMYHHFSERYPEFVQRVPQYLLASYLGFTPEYLSEIRRKKIS